MTNHARLESLKLNEWRQFQNIDISFHKQLTILTGPNGSGKSTILTLLGQCVTDDFDAIFVATPVQDENEKKSFFSLGTLFKRFNLFKAQETTKTSTIHSIGEIHYTDNRSSMLTVQDSDEIEYHVTFSLPREVPGFRIGSHAALPSYQKIDYVPVSGNSPRDAFSYYRQVQHGFDQGQTYQRIRRQPITNPVAPLKETLIGFAAFGSNNLNIRAVPELVGLFDMFQEKLQSTLPNELGFRCLEVRGSEVVIVSSTGDFPIDGASGGLMALIQATWQIFLFNQANAGGCVVLIDEPESHLHPSLQREFLSKLLSAFPEVQFIVATHSPFIVSSVKDSKIYALIYQQLPDATSGQEFRAVVSKEVDVRERGGTASEILATVLGVSVTVPTWAEEELSLIVEEFVQKNITDGSIEELKRRLDLSGLGNFFPEAIAKLPR